MRRRAFLATLAASLTPRLTWADVGAVNERIGITGISHVFEHMAFKGTRTVGTKDIEAELQAMAKEDETFYAWRAEYAKGALADSARLAALAAEHKAAIAAAKQFVKTPAYDDTPALKNCHLVAQRLDLGAPQFRVDRLADDQRLHLHQHCQ